MRATARVFLILSMVWGGISALSGAGAMALGELVAGAISLVNGAVAFFVSFIAIRRLARARERRELRVIGILTLIFANVVAGILFLCMNEYELGDTRQQYYGQPPYGQTPYGQNPYGQPPYGQNPYAQNPYGQNPYAQPTYQTNLPPYGGIYGAPYAAKKQAPADPVSDEPTDVPTDTPVETPHDTPSDAL